MACFYKKVILRRPHCDYNYLLGPGDVITQVGGFKDYIVGLIGLPDFVIVGAHVIVRVEGPYERWEAMKVLEVCPY